EDSRFNVVRQSTTFTSMLDKAVGWAAAREIDRVLKPRGILVRYDFYLNPTNPAVHSIGLVEFKTLLHRYKGSVRRVTLAPPVVRAAAPRSRALAVLLQQLLYIKSHLLAVLTKLVDSRSALRPACRSGA